MTWFTDNPIPLFILGLMAQVVLGIVLWQTGRGWVILVMAGLGIASIALVFVERLLVSPTEEIAETLDEIGAALETNQIDSVLAFVAPDQTVLRTDARQQLKRVKIEQALVAGDLRVAFDTPADAPQPLANASFNGRIKANFLKDASPHDQIVQRFKVYFRKENGKWLVTGYETNRR